VTEKPQPLWQDILEFMLATWSIAYLTTSLLQSCGLLSSSPGATLAPYGASGALSLVILGHRRYRARRRASREADR